MNKCIEEIDRVELNIYVKTLEEEKNKCTLK